ncbi:hypothetical protein GE061_004760 [Apolygus lucorum]|uniref:Integrase catalytic domain-containing protein n=1 Tax=Apolygus lucorum TaxID=248454 RepID=A0A8S9X221_APOLU|nr:hypothetical protein GE061_004760 [Apolygus lucorum]
MAENMRTSTGDSIVPLSVHLSVHSSVMENTVSEIVLTSVSHETDDLLKRMFEIESVEETVPWTPAEMEAEQLFLDKVQRSSDGRYTVPLPFAQDKTSLGDSRHIALRQLFRLESRLKKDPVLAQAYTKFMDEYLELGHMRRVAPPSPGLANYYLPHHPVVRPGDPSDKIRVVFNASQRTSNGCALNEILHAGPKLQPDISDIVLRFRSLKVVFIADIRQMFRQFKHPTVDHDMLRIVWRSSPSEPIQDYALCTVTYGTTSAPFLANRILRHLAQTEQLNHPLGSQVLLDRSYVDDIHGGGEDVTSAIAVRDDVIELLQSAGLELRKWASNDPKVLMGIPKDHCLPLNEDVDLHDDSEKTLKMLGIAWNPRHDSFFFKIPTTPLVRTKRELASQVGRIYDPCGWIMPTSVFARCIQREVCHAKYDWDDPLPSSLAYEWKRLASSMNVLTELRLPRHIDSSTLDQWLVGFADASEKAYAAVVYHVVRSGKNVQTRLVLSRARIAPIKSESIPRLELLAAELLGKTFKKVRAQFPLVTDDRIIACSDSTIALSWITADPAPVWKVFVGNRVAKTLSNVPPDRWFHVSSKDNPADIASRGELPDKLVQNSMWWNGPGWLSDERARWPIRRIRPDLSSENVIKEARANQPISSASSNSDDLEVRYSSLTKLKRVVAWVQRFVRNCRNRSVPRRRRSLTVEQLVMQVPPLDTSELKHAELALVRRAQARGFPDVIRSMDHKGSSTKLMKQLAIFRSDDGLLRVGGRLDRADSSFETRHPTLLPAKDVLTDLVVRHAHQSCLHVGPRATLAHIRTKHWIVNGRNVVNKCLSGCVRCFSIKPRSFQPEMGQLPAGRVHQTYPFNQTGIDFAGPFSVSIAGLRGTRKIEIFLAVFVCLATKAVHLEAVLDLSTDSFMQCLERFMARRGVPAVIWSDNGTNFVGANNLLRKIRSALAQGVAHDLTDQLATRGIQWKFIPPRAPHFGGLWEAAVKSAKRLIRVTLRDQTTTYQTFTTIVARVESVLNSRPLVYQSSSPDDILVLTPGHFLVQRPLTALPESTVDHTASTRLVPKWAFVNQMVDQFWKKWSKEYLLDLQLRSKWNTPDRPPKLGDVVLIMEDNRPPLQWVMGVICELCPGDDGTARVALVRTSSGVLKRPLVKLCPLPKDID